MANVIYATVKGKQQGLISAGCSSMDSIGNKGQAGHLDQILINSLNYAMSREQHVSHHPVVFTKPIDKSSPLLGVAISSNESLEVLFEFYRTNASGAQELYFTILLTDATISDISGSHPHSINPQRRTTARNHLFEIQEYYLEPYHCGHQWLQYLG